MGRPIGAFATVVIALVLAAAACGGKAEFDRDATMKSGDAFLAARQWRKAIAEYRKVIAADPREVPARLKLAEALRETQQWTASAHEVIAAADLAPNDPEIQLLAIAAMNNQGRFDDALDRVAPLLKAAPDNPRLLVIYGNAKARLTNPVWVVWRLSDALSRGDSYEGALLVHIRSTSSSDDDREAERAYSRAYAVAPADGDVAMAMAGFFLVTRRPDPAREILVKLVEENPGNAFLGRTVGLVLNYLGMPEGERFLRRAADSGDQGAQLDLAALLGRRKQYDEAIALLKPLTQGEDADEKAIVRTADFELLRGNHAAAQSLADSILGKNPNDAEGLRIKAHVLLQTGAAAAALPVARNAVAASPTSREARLALARALHATGDINGAFAEYTVVWRADTRDAAVAKTLAGIALALGRDGVAGDLAGQSLRLSPGDKEAALIAARANIRLGNLAAAERALATFGAAKATSADALALEGSIQAGRGRVDLARASFIKALQIAPNSIDALTLLVDVDIKAGRAGAIRAQIEQAANAHAGDPAYLLLAARIAIAERNAARAESALRAVLEKDPGREDASMHYAAFLVPQGRLKDAQIVIEKSLEKRPGSVALRLALGDLLERQSMFAEARAQYERVISDNQIAAGTTEMLNAQHTGSARLARLLANQGTNLEEALQHASSAMRYKPNDPLFADTIGWVHTRKQRARLGLPYLEMALKADPVNPLVRYHLGVAYDQLGDIPKARQELAEALRLDAAFNGADAARTLLKTLSR